MALGSWFKSSSTMRKFAQQTIWSRVQKGWSPTKIVNFLKEKDLGYHRQTMFEDIKYWKAAHVNGLKVRFTQLGAKFNPHLIVDNVFKQTSKYKIVFKLSYKDSMTGEIKSRNVSYNVQHEENGQMVDDEYLNGTRQEYQDRFLDTMRTPTTYTEGNDVTDIMPVMVFRR